MAKPTAYVINGLGIGCHKEVAHAFEKAGAEAKIVHYRQLLAGGRDFLFKAQILNPAGGFLHGDKGGAAMYAANELEHSGIKSLLIEFAEKGNVIYGQCNGFQLLVRTGLLPGINGDYSKQTATLTDNECGNYRVAPVWHMAENEHFAFKGLEDPMLLWCRHGEGNLQFWSPFGSVSDEQGIDNRRDVNDKHVLLRYTNQDREIQEEFPYNPNGSVDGIAGLVDPTGNIIGHMAHPEVSVYASRDPRYFPEKDKERRMGTDLGDLEEHLADLCVGGEIFQNIVDEVRRRE